MDKKDHFIDILKRELGFKEIYTEEEYKEYAANIFRKELFGREFIAYISVIFQEDETILGVSISPRLNREEGLDIYSTRFSLDKTKKLIDRYRKICKI